MIYQPTKDHKSVNYQNKMKKVKKQRKQKENRGEKKGKEVKEEEEELEEAAEEEIDNKKSFNKLIYQIIRRKVNSHCKK